MGKLEVEERGEDKIKSGGWQCNVEYFKDYVIKTPKTEDQIKKRIGNYLESHNKLDELKKRVKDMQRDWKNSIDLINKKKLPLNFLANTEFLENGKIKQTRVIMLSYIFQELYDKNKIEELKLIINKTVDFIIKFWRYGLVEKTSKIGMEFGLMNNEIVLVDFGELSDEKKVAEKQVVELKWYKNLEKYLNKEIADLFIKFAKKKLTLKVLNENWEKFE